MQITISIGNTKVNRIGLGTNRLTDNPETRRLLNRAVELGINFIDTSNIYTGGESEKTIGRTLSPFPENLVVATKGGMVPGAPANNDPAYLRSCIDESLSRLKTNCITLYQLHRINPDTTIEDTMRFFREMQEEGKIKHIGLSEVTVRLVERAREITEITSVQNQYNLAERKNEDVLNYCEKNNIIFIPYYPLDKRNEPSNTLNTISKKYNSSPQQISLAWLLKRSPVMLPIPGTLSVRHIEENANALSIELSDEDFEKLDILKQK